MPTTWYCQSNASGTNAGTSANPFQTLSAAAAAYAAGDTILVNTTANTPYKFTLSTAVAWNTAGSYNTRVKIVGVNSSWVEDGTLAVVDGNSAAANCFTKGTSSHFLIFRNFELKNSTGSAFVAGAYYNFNRNIYIHNCGTYGVTGNGYDSWEKSTVGNSGSVGFYGCSSAVMCISYSASTSGLQGVSNVVFGNIAYDCTTYGIYGGISIINNVVNNCNYGIVFSVLEIKALGNRLTNNATTGLYVSNNCGGYEDFNFFLGNGATITLSGTGYCYSPGNSLSAGTEGYTNKAGKVFNLTDAATLRRTATKVGAF